MQGSLSKALIAELIGTFTLIFIGVGAGALDVGLLPVAFAFGGVVIGLAYAYGHISGTHINPAVTLGVWASGKMEGGRAAAYVISQLLGGVLGAFALRWVLGGTETGLGVTALAQNLQVGDASITVMPLTGLILEAILTFILVNSVMNAGISGKATHIAGIAVGFTLIALILMGAPLTGASLNPARSLGPALAASNYTDLWLYLLGPILGGVTAGLLYRGVLADE